MIYLILIFSKFDKQYLAKCYISCYKRMKYTLKTISVEICSKKIMFLITTLWIHMMVHN